jgi:hypothetical protein
MTDQHGFISADDFRRVLVSRGIERLVCPACANDYWDGHTDVGIHVLAGRNADTGEIGRSPGSIHAIATTCTRCGYIATFNRDVIGE